MSKVRIPVDENLGEMLNWAVRYALGRRTYAVSDTCSFISPLVPYLDDRTLCCMLRDIEEQENRPAGYGDECDEEDWLNLGSLLEKEIERRSLAKWK